MGSSLESSIEVHHHSSGLPQNVLGPYFRGNGIYNIRARRPFTKPMYAMPVKKIHVIPDLRILSLWGKLPHM